MISDIALNNNKYLKYNSQMALFCIKNSKDTNTPNICQKSRDHYQSAREITINLKTSITRQFN
jgi:hypothetical protein